MPLQCAAVRSEARVVLASRALRVCAMGGRLCECIVCALCASPGRELCVRRVLCER